MYCTKCGAKNEDNTWKCTQCGKILTHIVASTAQTHKIPSYLAQSILVTVLCCVFLGVPAIVYASQVNSKVSAGDIEAALNCSRKAKMWCWIALGLGLTVQLINILLMFIPLLLDRTM